MFRGRVDELPGIGLRVAPKLAAAGRFECGWMGTQRVERGAKVDLGCRGAAVSRSRLGN